MSILKSMSLPDSRAKAKGEVIFVLLLLALILSVIVSAASGAMSISLQQTIAILAAKLDLQLPWTFSPQEDAVIWSIRLPRLFVGVLVGSSLAMAGASLQGLFRNPLADPGLLGISNGAAFGAALAIVIGGAVATTAMGAWASYAVPVFAFLGGLAVTLVVFRLSTRRGITSSTAMLLAGIALNALVGALIGLLIYVADDVQLRNITFWLLGSLAGADWNSVLALALFALPPIAILFRFSYSLDVMLLGEREAGHLGIDVQRIKILVVTASALLVGAATAVAGIVGFIGLVAPHIMRIILGSKHTSLFPGVCLFGALLVIVADLAARTIVAPAELPIGILTSAIGGPFFLWLLMQKFRQLSMP